MALVLGGCAAMQPPETLYTQQRRFDELRRHMEATTPDPAKAEFSRLFYLCYAYSRVKRYDRLFPCVDLLQARVDAGDNKLYWFDFRSAPSLLRAEARLDFGDLPAAIAEAETAERLTRGRDAYKQMRIYALTATALAHAASGDAARARVHAAELEAMTFGFTEGLMASDKYYGLARIAMALGEPARAIAAIEADDRQTGFKGLVDAITGAGLMGESLFTYWEVPKRAILHHAQIAVGNFAAARSGLDALLAMPQSAASGDLYWLLLDDRARIALKDGERERAIVLLQRAVAAIEAARATIGNETSRIGFAGDRQQVYARLVAALVESGREREAFEAAERGKARALIDLLASRRELIPTAAGTNGGGDALAALETAEADFRALQASTGGIAATRRAAVDTARARLRTTAPELESLVSVTSGPAADVQALLAPGDVLIEYFGAEPDLFAFVVSATTLRAVRLDGAGLRGEVGQARLALQDPAADPLPPARRLYDRLVAPLALPAGARLVVVPHGPLHYLPFAALHSGEGWLIERHAIRVLPSAGVMAFLDGRKGTGSRLLALGNPDVGDPRLALEFAEAEATAIVRGRPDATLLVGHAATETAVKQQGGAYALLHLASHGQFRADDPLGSALLLAPDAANDGRLSAAEIYGLKLNADLVTLSACQTGLGKVAGGDDVIGITRGLLFAGTASVLSSLWSVDDEATRDLMVRFYAELPRQPKAEALRRAQQSVRLKRPHPFYWAAFTLTGNG
ncbi:MAG: CHAT domain-containing protein [Magnetospirillum sp.]|nr:CHAT domain-containing protein [Magnetospirillum sp.]